MATPDDALTRAATTYNAAADHYDDAANSFWARFGRATVERLQLSAGAHVLDVCCGSGASALPAAQAVGPQGHVTGVDLASNLPDMAAGVRSLWSAVRPGGRLAITTWGPRWFEPGTTAFWNAVREARPELYK